MGCGVANDVYRRLSRGVLGFDLDLVFTLGLGNADGPFSPARGAMGKLFVGG